jgi:hypothetical protein
MIGFYMFSLEIVSWSYLSFSLLSFIIILVDVLMGQSQKMKIMNLVWPISALYLGPFALYFYFRHERVRPQVKCCCKVLGKTSADRGHVCCQRQNKAACDIVPKKMQHMDHNKMMNKGVNLKSIFLSSLHCGAGCVLGDILAEFVILFVGITIFGAAIWASFFIDFAAALIFGLAFQYYTIHPMKPELSKLQVIWQAIKADVLSLTFFEIGLFGWMLACYYIFTPVLVANQVVFWFMMQIGMILGLLTTMPINYLLIKWGIKSSCSH